MSVEENHEDSKHAANEKSSAMNEIATEQHHSVSLSTLATAASIRKKPLQLQCNGTYMAVLAAFIVALIGLLIAIFLAFNSIRAVQTDLKKVEMVINSSLIEIFKVFNITQGIA